MKTENKLALLTAMAAMTGAFGFDDTPNFQRSRKAEPKLDRSIDLDKLNESHGLKKWDYPEGSVWAINKKNAIRKAKKLGYTVNA